MIWLWSSRVSIMTIIIAISQLPYCSHNNIVTEGIPPESSRFLHDCVTSKYYLTLQTFVRVKGNREARLGKGRFFNVIILSHYKLACIYNQNFKLFIVTIPSIIAVVIVIAIVFLRRPLHCKKYLNTWTPFKNTFQTHLKNTFGCLSLWNKTLK